MNAPVTRMLGYTIVVPSGLGKRSGFSGTAAGHR